MDYFLKRFILDQWPRKLAALVCATILWLFVNHSITDTKTLTNIPVRIINIPKGMMIPGVFPNGMLKKRMTLTLSGSRDVIQELESSDLEILLDASTNDHEDWIIKVGKKNLVSLNPAIDLSRHITEVIHSEFVLKPRSIVKTNIPLHLLPPSGEVPKGYIFLDIWPNMLTQTVEGAKGELFPYQVPYLEFSLPLDNVSQEDLEALAAVDQKVNFLVPNSWKQIPLPDKIGKESLNDPRAEHLTMTFLRSEKIPLRQPILVQVFYPPDTLDTINPKTHPLATNEYLKNEKGVFLLSLPLNGSNVDSLFLSCVENHLALVIIAEKQEKWEPLDWNLIVVDEAAVENKYVQLSLEKDVVDQGDASKELLYRNRFQKFLNTMTLSSPPDHLLHIEAFLEDKSITIKSYF